jgi:hypothetical protein
VEVRPVSHAKVVGTGEEPIGSWATGVITDEPVP